MKIRKERYLKVKYSELEELKEFLKEHESELYADETKRCLYMNLLELETFVLENMSLASK